VTERDIMSIEPTYVEHRIVSDDDVLRSIIMNKTIVSENGCWEWKGAKDRGYGVIMRNGERLRVHRVSYELWGGTIPDGMVVRHKCDNPSCVNPGHLVYGTQAQNIHDIIARGKFAKTKLNAAQVEEIRLSPKSNRELASEYGVGILSIRRTRAGEAYKHIPLSSSVRGQ